jgi:RNA-directed DNA polymerase
VDVDIKGYFDNIPHEPLMKLVKERIADGKVLDLIEAFLKQSVIEDGKETVSQAGTPQGGIISPLLANIYLDPLDHLLGALGLQSARYADDIVILAPESSAAHQALATVREWMTAAGLTLHPEKTRVVDMNEAQAHFDVASRRPTALTPPLRCGAAWRLAVSLRSALGYRFLRSKKGKLIRLVRPKSKKKLRESLKPVTKRANGQSLPAIIARINPVLRGWFEYFVQACLREHQEMDQWVRMRLRSILRKRSKGQGRGRGLDHFKWPNGYFEDLGLFSLERARGDVKMSLRSKGANC